MSEGLEVSVIWFPLNEYGNWLNLIRGIVWRTMENKDAQVRWIWTSASCIRGSGGGVGCRWKHKHFQINASVFPWKPNRKGRNVIWWKSLVCVRSEGSHVVRNYRIAGVHSADLSHKTVSCNSTFLIRQDDWGSSSSFLAWENSSGLRLWWPGNLYRRATWKHIRAALDKAS